MPRNREAWAAWNYHAMPEASHPRVSLTANCAYLHGIPTSDAILTTLNLHDPPDPALTQDTFQYEHLVYDVNTLKAQEKVSQIQDVRNIVFAGAWLGYGFHEDGFTTGIRAAKQICPELQLPFELKNWQAESEPKKLPTWQARCFKMAAALVHLLLLT